MASIVLFVLRHAYLLFSICFVAFCVSIGFIIYCKVKQKVGVIGLVLCVLFGLLSIGFGVVKNCPNAFVRRGVTVYVYNGGYFRSYSGDSNEFRYEKWGLYVRDPWGDDMDCDTVLVSLSHSSDKWYVDEYCVYDVFFCGENFQDSIFDRIKCIFFGSRMHVASGLGISYPDDVMAYGHIVSEWSSCSDLGTVIFCRKLRSLSDSERVSCFSDLCDEPSLIELMKYLSMQDRL